MDAWSYLFVSIPLVLNVAAILAYRGTFRRAAFLTLPIIILASGADLYSASQGGNLTGLITIIISGPLLVVLLLIGLGNFASMAWLGRAGPDGSPTLPRTNVLRFALLGAVVGTLAGGLLLGGMGGFFAGMVGSLVGSSDGGWLRRHAIGLPAWPLGAGVGLAGGAAVAWLFGLRHRP